MKANLAAVELIEHSLQLFKGLDVAGIERIDDNLITRGLGLNQEMTGETDAFNGETNALPHFHVENRQRNRQAALALNDLIQEAILGIVVIVAIAAKTMLLEQDVIKRGERTENIAIGARALADLDGQFIDTPEIAGDVEIGIVGERDSQRGAAEIDAFFRPLDSLTKFSVGIGNQCAVVWGSVIERESPGEISRSLSTTKITKDTKGSEN